MSDLLARAEEGLLYAAGDYLPHVSSTLMTVLVMTGAAVLKTISFVRVAEGPEGQLAVKVTSP